MLAANVMFNQTFCNKVTFNYHYRSFPMTQRSPQWLARNRSLTMLWIEVKHASASRGLSSIAQLLAVRKLEAFSFHWHQVLSFCHKARVIKGQTEFGSLQPGLRYHSSHSKNCTKYYKKLSYGKETERRLLRFQLKSNFIRKITKLHFWATLWRH